MRPHAVWCIPIDHAACSIVSPRLSRSRFTLAANAAAARGLLALAGTWADSHSLTRNEKRAAAVYAHDDGPDRRQGMSFPPADRKSTHEPAASSFRLRAVPYLSDMAEDVRSEIEGATDGQLGQIIESARAMVAEQFQIAERYDRKARYQAASAGAFFAVVQAIVINAITRTDLSSSWKVTLATFAVPAALLTVGAFIAAADAWRTQKEKDLPIPDLRELVESISRGDEHALRTLAGHCLNLAEARKAANKQRLSRVKKVAATALLSIILTGIELVLIFVALANLNG